MNRLARLQTILLVALLLCSCSARNREAEISPLLDANGRVKPEPAIAKLAQLYQAARSEQERRAVCLRAIDEGRIKRGAPVSTFDQIFGTHFASQPAGAARAAQKVLLFATQPEPPAQLDSRIEAVPYVGSYLVLDYDRQGAIQNYYLSNLHKGIASRIVDQKTISIAELKRLYETALSETERRDVALRAIDEGRIQTFPRVHVSTVDTLFGTHLESTLPTRKQGTLTGFVDFTSQSSTDAGNQTHTRSGWFMAVEYDADGNLANYYITNIQK